MALYRKRRLVRIALACSVAALMAATFAYPLPWLMVRDSHGLRYAFPGGEGARFTLRWMHSVEKEDWEEWFEVTANGAIELTGTRFKTFGAGVPSAAGKVTTLDDGWVVMTGIHRVVDPLAVQAAAAEHYRMRYDYGPVAHTFALSLASPPPILSFRVESAPLWQMLPALVRPWRVAYPAAWAAEAAAPSPNPSGISP